MSQFLYNAGKTAGQAAGHLKNFLGNRAAAMASTSIPQLSALRAAGAAPGPGFWIPWAIAGTAEPTANYMAENYQKDPSYKAQVNQIQLGRENGWVPADDEGNGWRNIETGAYADQLPTNLNPSAGVSIPTLSGTIPKPHLTNNELDKFNLLPFTPTPTEESIAKSGNEIAGISEDALLKSLETSKPNKQLENKKRATVTPKATLASSGVSSKDSPNINPELDLKNKNKNNDYDWFNQLLPLLLAGGIGYYAGK